MQPYAGFDMDRYVRRTFCSWDDIAWRSLLVQCFDHVPAVDEMALPATADLHLVLTTEGSAEMETRTSRGWRREQWVPGRVEMSVPAQQVLRRYRAAAPLRTLQVHLPYRTVERIAEQLGGPAVDHERTAAAVATGDPVVEHTMRALATARGEGDLYAESAAAFLAVHLLTRPGRRPGLGRPASEDTRMRRAVEVMRERLAEPLTLAEIAAEVSLSVYHFIRVFKETTGETPHRFLTRVRVEEARRLLGNSDLSIAQVARRCGFATPGSFSTAFLRHTGLRPSAYRNN